MAVAAAVKVYSWRDGARYSVRAEVFAEVVERIEAANGVATPQAVVDAARSTRSPIHGLFNWNDAEAAELYREDQARAAMRSLRVTVRMEEGPKVEPVVAFVSVNRGDARGYVNSDTVMADPLLRECALDEARRFLAGARARFKHLGELQRVWEVIEEELAKL